MKKIILVALVILLASCQKEIEKTHAVKKPVFVRISTSLGDTTLLYVK